MTQPTPISQYYPSIIKTKQQTTNDTKNSHIHPPHLSQTQTLNPQPSTINPQPSTLNPRPISSYNMVILPTVSNLEQTHIRQIYNSTQIRSTPYIAPRNLVTKAHPTSISSTHSTHPTYVTTNPHSKSNHLSLYLAHLSI